MQQRTPVPDLGPIVHSYLFIRNISNTPTVVECVRVSRIMAKMQYTGFPVAFLKQVGAPKVRCVSYVVSFPKFHYSDKLAAFPSTLKLRGNVSNGF